MEDIARKDFARIVRGGDGRQVVAYIEYTGKKDHYALVVMVPYPDPMSNTYALEHGTLDEMEILLEAFDAEQAHAVLHCNDMNDRRAWLLAQHKSDVRPFRR